VIGSGALVDGRYRLESIIGAGGMGVVWAATHERLDRKVALKQIPLVVNGGEPAERIRARTLREARITASLNEVDGVVRIANYFDDEHNVWLELEYLDALNLAELIQATGGLPPAEVAWIGARVARALAGGHALDPPVQHRDIKPGNVLVGRDGDTVKLSDYGISRRDRDPAVTMIGAIHATLPYAAPEVVREYSTTVESDIWSLGATLYHAVEGRLPYGDHDSNQSLIEAVRAADIRPMGRAGPQLGPILERMLVVNPTSRIDADTAAEELERIAAPLGAQTRTHLGRYRPHRRTALVHETVTRPAPEPVAPKRGRGRKVALGALVLVVLAGLGVGIGAAVAGWPRTAAPPPTTTPAAPPTNAAIPGLPAQVGYVALANPSPDVDPCRLADLPALKALGEVTADPGANFASCTVQIEKGSSVAAALTIEVGDGNTPTNPRRPAIDLGGVTLLSGATPTKPGFGCYTYLVLADRSQIEVSGYYPARGSSDDYDRLCSIADIGAAGVVRQIASGNAVPATEGRGATIALSGLDACGLLDRSLVPEVATAPSTGYNRWSCVLGSAKEGAERVEVNLQFRPQFEPTGTIGPYRVRQTSGSSEYGVRGCAVYVEVVHQAAVAPGRSEIVRFGSFGQAGYDDQCARAQKLATAAIGKLPAPS
jgi:eukaryotic-like serine/threonine-protein kinase